MGCFGGGMPTPKHPKHIFFARLHMPFRAYAIALGIGGEMCFPPGKN